MTALNQPVDPPARKGWPFPAKVAFVGFLAVAAFFLWTEHRAHLFAYWPFSLIFVCLIMHVFMHHGGHDDGKPMPPMSGTMR